MNDIEILVVEDDPIIAGFINYVLSFNNWKITIAESSEEAWALLDTGSNQFKTILLDCGLPNMSGIELLKKIKSSPYKEIPVIMETGDLLNLQAGLSAGAYYYLTKPLQRDLLQSICIAAVSQFIETNVLREEVRRARRSMDYIHSAEFRIKTLDEARILANGLARACSESEKAITGLVELLYNAIEHGNLGITYEEKKQLLIKNMFTDEVNNRLAVNTKYVTVTLTRNIDSIEVIIKDQGNGFDPTRFLTIDPDRACDPNGRGIALANMISIDKLDYLGNGNTARLVFFNKSNQINCNESSNIVS